MSASTPLDAFLASAPSVPSAGTISLGLTVNLPDGTQLALSPTLDASQLLPALQAVAQRISASSSATPQKIQAVVSTQRACKAEISKLHKRVNQLAKTVTKELAATRKEALAAAAGLTRSTPSSSSGVEQVLSASPSSNDIAMVTCSRLESARFLNRPLESCLLSATARLVSPALRLQPPRGCASLGAPARLTPWTGCRRSRTCGCSSCSIRTVAAPMWSKLR